MNYEEILKKQCQAALGITFYGNSLAEEKIFKKWLKRQQKIKELYRHYLLTIRINYDDRNSAEIGKGFYDALSVENGLSPIVTRYYDTFKGKNYAERIIPGTLYTENKRVYVVAENKLKRSFSYTPFEGINLFYTQNIYLEKELNPFIQIHNNGKSILLGAYGRIIDKDRLAKIGQLRSIKEQLTDGKYQEFYAYANQDYVYFLYSDPERDRNKHQDRKKYVMIKER